mmetsp:Transcript_21238/g.55424  ORF Transcript_21238/g.55424 Transcript_21238/m.55424 type:complete len:96 (-) Transcript_21238:779-1066(-)
MRAQQLYNTGLDRTLLPRGRIWISPTVSPRTGTTDTDPRESSNVRCWAGGTRSVSVRGGAYGAGPPPVARRAHYSIAVDVKMPGEPGIGPAPQLP